MKKIVLLCFALLLLTPRVVMAQYNPLLYVQADQDRMNQWADSVFDSLTPEERLGQMFVLVLDANTNEKNLELAARYVKELKIGGLLFSKGTVRGQADLTNYCQSMAKVPLLITSDSEWGLAMRLPDAPKFPLNMVLGAIVEDSLVYQYGREVGRQCRRMGIHVNYAPVVDVNSNPLNPVIGRRSFGQDPERVAAKAIAYARGLEDEGVMAVAKHFPGHGDTAEDSHYTLPMVSHSKERLFKVELYPFRRYIDSGLSGMMVGHLQIPALDNVTKSPTSLSPLIVEQLLQQQMGFRGLTFTDALEMKGASNEKDLAMKAILAGNDIILKPLNPFVQMQMVRDSLQEGVISHKLIEEKCLKILQYKYILGLANGVKVDTKNIEKDLNNYTTERLIRNQYAAAVTLLQNGNELLPLKGLTDRKVAVVVFDPTAENPFTKMLNQYSPITVMRVNSQMKSSSVDSLASVLESYNTVVYAISSLKKADVALANYLCRKKSDISVFFTSPYEMVKFNENLTKSRAVILAYDNTVWAQETAAEIIFGGISASGIAPVTVGDLCLMGDGKKTEANRLGYALPEDVEMDSRLLAKIDDIVLEGLTHEAYPGCQVLVARHGKVIYNKAFGYFDYSQKRPVTTRDVYDLASITKAAATVTALMKLYDNQRLDVYRRLSAYIPSLRGVEDKYDLTVRDALFHETGMPASLSMNIALLDPASIPVTGVFSKQKNNHYTGKVGPNSYVYDRLRLKPQFFSSVRSETYPMLVAQGIYATEEFRKILFTDVMNVHLRPNKTYLYSCLNFVLLQKVVENITRKPMDQFLNKYFFAPLGATTTTYRPLQKLDSATIVPTEYDPIFRRQLVKGYPHDEMACFMGGVSGNAGLFSNANDLAKLLQMILNRGSYGGERYLSPETVSDFTATRSRHSRRGLGFDKPDVSNPENSPTCPEANASVFGHTGFTGTCYWVDPVNDLIYIFLSNRVNGGRWHNELTKRDIRTRIQSVIYQSIIH